MGVLNKHPRAFLLNRPTRTLGHGGPSAWRLGLQESGESDPQGSRWLVGEVGSDTSHDIGGRGSFDGQFLLSLQRSFNLHRGETCHNPSKTFENGKGLSLHSIISSRRGAEALAAARALPCMCEGHGLQYAERNMQNRLQRLSMCLWSRSGLVCTLVWKYQEPSTNRAHLGSSANSNFMLAQLASVFPVRASQRDPVSFLLRQAPRPKGSREALFHHLPAP